jgi:hypothetical protein
MLSLTKELRAIKDFLWFPELIAINVWVISIIANATDVIAIYYHKVFSSCATLGNATVSHYLLLRYRKNLKRLEGSI